MGTCQVAVVGGAMMDFAVRGEALPGPGQSAAGDEFHRGMGGKGANAAVAASRIGARATLLASVGSDEEGDRICTGLRGVGVQTAWVERVDHLPTGATLVHVDRRGRKQTLSHPGAVLAFRPGHLALAREVIAAADVLLCQLEPALDTVEHALAIARESETKIVLDAAPAQPLTETMMRGIDLLCANAGEAEALTGIEVVDAESAERAAQSLLSRGCRSVAIAAGESGKLIATGSRCWILAPLHVEVRDTTGAGDAFAAAAAVRLAEGAPLEDAARFAHAAAALATRQLGAQSALPDRAAILEMLSRDSDARGGEQANGG